METMPTLVLVLMLATLVVLVVGLVLMAVGGKINQKYSNKLMTLRVALQAAAIGLLLLMFFLSGGSK